MRQSKLVLSGIALIAVGAVASALAVEAILGLSRLSNIADSLCVPRTHLVETWIKGDLLIESSSIGNMTSYCAIVPYQDTNTINRCAESRYDLGDPDATAGCIDAALKFRRDCAAAPLSYGKVWQTAGLISREGVEICGGRFFFARYEYNSTGG